MPIELPTLDPAFWAVFVAVGVAGIVRGFSGFGSGMIVGPVAAAAYSPQAAVVILLIIEVLPTIPLVIAALRKVKLKEIAPIVAGYAMLLPLGLWFLTTGEATVLRWFMSISILAVVVVLWTGWQYQGPRTVPVRIGVGGLSGFLGGAISVPGPPVILYWMALRTGAGFVRANLIVYFAATSIVAGIGLYLSGLLTPPAVGTGAAMMPVFLVTLLVGARLFGMASETTYRRIALVIVLAAAVLTVPALDGLRG